MYEKIDINTWDRRDHYAHFKRMKTPHYMLSANIDVSRLLEYKKERRLSFYLSLIYLVTKTLNSIENFHLRILNGEVVRYDRIETNFTHIRPGEELFYYHTAPFEGCLEEYVRRTTEAISTQTTLFGGLGDIPNVAYCSCAPTLYATAIGNPGLDNPEDAIPRINWGKYIKQDGRWLLNISFTANHRFIDGYHLGLFFQTLQEEINQLPLHE